MPPRRLAGRTACWVVAALVALALGLAACGGDDGDEPAAKAKATPAATSATETPADTAFVNDMIPHHESAVDMARIAQTRAQHAELRALADAIITAQRGEIATMKRIRSTLVEQKGTFGLSHEEMGMDHDLGALRRSKRFDREFIDMMVPHHDGAILMAQLLLDDGGVPELRSMAKDIISAQKAEIAQMREWRKAWYGSADPPAAIGGGLD